MNIIKIKTILMFMVSILFALILSILPLPDWAVWFRPEWVAMVMIYWVIVVPHRINVGSAWVVGLLVDTLNGTVLGEHALLLALLTYVVSLLHKELRVLPLWQQSLAVLFLLWLYQAGIYLLQGIMGESPGTWVYYGSAVTSVLFWPWIFILLRDSRRSLRIA